MTGAATADEPVTLRRVPVRMFLPPDCQKVTPVIRRDREWQPASTQWILERIRRGDTFVDVGAHAGYFTLIVAKVVGAEGHVYAFEPDAMNFGLLERNVKENDLQNVIAVRKAVTDAAGPRRLYRSATNSGDHRVSKAEEDRAFSYITSVTLDGYLGSKPVQMVKIDTQGAESMVLGGMQDILRANPAICLHVEFWPYGLSRAGSSGRALLKTLDEAGFLLSRGETARLEAAYTVENRKHTNLMLQRGGFKG